MTLWSKNCTRSLDWWPKHEDICQLWSLENGRPIYNKIMSRQRFQDVLWVLRFDDAEYRRQHRSDDNLEPTRECFDLWVNTLRDGNVPGSMLTVDEELVTFRGRCPFKQYIPSKPGRYGIKFWILLDSKWRYVWRHAQLVFHIRSFTALFRTQ